MNGIIMRMVWCLIVLSLWPTGWAFAAELPEPGSRDQRVRYVTYKQDEVTTIHVSRGVITRIVLGEDEKIVTAATGFQGDCAKPEAEWCIRADVGTNHVWVKPKDHATHNNLEIRTNKRDYSLEFQVLADHKPARSRKSSDGHGPEEAMYRVIFRHSIPLPNPQSVMALNAALDHSKQAREEQQTLADRLASFTPEPKNWAYSMEVLSGSDEIAPALVFDDGRFTYFSFPPNRDIPAIFYLSPIGEETRLNVHMEKEFAVVERMGRRFVLRLGQAVVGVWNEAYERDGVPPANGVTVSGVSRLLR
ncbi:MAG: conjugal transfer protein [Nitrospira sp.]|nr:MAG: conjugal transfer protein [Nitrospira sp.]